MLLCITFLRRHDASQSTTYATERQPAEAAAEVNESLAGETAGGIFTNVYLCSAVAFYEVGVHHSCDHQPKDGLRAINGVASC
jgi:hypothetical protein